MEVFEKNQESHNIEKGIKEQVILPLIVEYNKNMGLSHYGTPGINADDSDRSRVKYLRFAISNLIMIIESIISDVEIYQYQSWMKKYRKKEDRELHPYDKEENDVDKLNSLREILMKNSEAIERASQTKTEKDDFTTTQRNGEIQGVFVNKRFRNLQDNVGRIYSIISKIMGDNGIKMYRRDEENWEKSIEELFEEGIMTA